MPEALPLSSASASEVHGVHPLDGVAADEKRKSYQRDIRANPIFTE